MSIKPEVGLYLKNCVATSDYFDPRNLSAKFQRNRFVKSTELGNFATEIGVRSPPDVFTSLERSRQLASDYVNENFDKC